jgi:hypothetical protein
MPMQNKMVNDQAKAKKGNKKAMQSMENLTRGSGKTNDGDKEFSNVTSGSRK